jgi:hypothetical protein
VEAFDPIRRAVARAIAAQDESLSVDDEGNVVSVDEQASVREYAGDPFILAAIGRASDIGVIPDSPLADRVRGVE